MVMWRYFRLKNTQQILDILNCWAVVVYEPCLEVSIILLWCVVLQSYQWNRMIEPQMMLVGVNRY